MQGRQKGGLPRAAICALARDSTRDGDRTPCQCRSCRSFRCGRKDGPAPSPRFKLDQVLCAHLVQDPVPARGGTHDQAEVMVRQSERPTVNARAHGLPTLTMRTGSSSAHPQNRQRIGSLGLISFFWPQSPHRYSVPPRSRRRRSNDASLCTPHSASVMPSTSARPARSNRCWHGGTPHSPAAIRSLRSSTYSQGSTSRVRVLPAHSRGGRRQIARGERKSQREARKMPAAHPSSRARRSALRQRSAT